MKNKAKKWLEDNGCFDTLISYKESMYKRNVSDAMVDFAHSLTEPVSDEEIEKVIDPTGLTKNSSGFEEAILATLLGEKIKGAKWYRDKYGTVDNGLAEALETIKGKAEHAMGFKVATPSIYEQIKMIVEQALNKKEDK